MKPCKYLDELIDYGGEPYTRAEVILDMQRSNTPQPCIDRWLQGYEHAQRRREPNQRITIKLSSHPPTNQPDPQNGRAVPKQAGPKPPSDLPKPRAQPEQRRG